MFELKDIPQKLIEDCKVIERRLFNISFRDLNLLGSHTLAFPSGTLLPRLISGNLRIQDAEKLLDGLNINGDQHG